MAKTMLSEKGQVVIPAEVRSRLGLKRGDRFEVEATDTSIILKLQPRDPLVSLRGAFAGPDSLAEALLEERRRERLLDRA
jgi:AbrB family looped-hinge helix DNA binding protein